jgi:NosR/NirI family nitrous oxide reductase transcriptional regulator
VHKPLPGAIACALLFLASPLCPQDRFPRPEFESGYALPQIQEPQPRAGAWLAVDAVALAAAIGVSAFLVLKKRSRIGIVVLSAVSVLYFGFIRKGCICPVGGIQNVSQALFDSAYGLSLPTAIFFILPIAAALFTGRTYCAGVCPFGALQDLVHIKTVRIPAWIDRPLSVLPFLYLGFSVLCAATGIGYFICRWDPFVGFFRFSMGLPMAIFSAAVLVSSLFIGRPYCRWLCPYGAVLSCASALSRRHATIAPGECVDCRLCEQSCPVDAILLPVERPRGRETDRLHSGLRRLILLAPVMLLTGALTGFLCSTIISPLHPDVALAAQIARESEFDRGSTPQSSAFLASGVPFSELEASAARAKADITLGSTLFGIFASVVFFLFLVSSYRIRRAEGYRIHQGRCVSCARCFEFCPVRREGST